RRRTVGSEAVDFSENSPRRHFRVKTETPLSSCDGYIRYRRQADLSLRMRTLNCLIIPSGLNCRLRTAISIRRTPNFGRHRVLRAPWFWKDLGQGSMSWKSEVPPIITSTEKEELQDLRRRHPEIAEVISQMNLYYLYYY